MGWAARANRKRGPKLKLTITLEQSSRRVSVSGPDDLDEAMKMLHAAALLVDKERKKKANGNTQGSRIIKPGDAEAIKILSSK
jgi:hypothetical protein